MSQRGFTLLDVLAALLVTALVITCTARMLYGVQRSQADIRHIPEAAVFLETVMASELSNDGADDARRRTWIDKARQHGWILRITRETESWDTGLERIDLTLSGDSFPKPMTLSRWIRKP